MQTATVLHELLLDFRQETGAQLCSVTSPEFGTRVEVGRPTTLSADELEWDAPKSSKPEHDAVNRFRHLSATVAGYSIMAEFESVDAADKARPQFDQLVREIEILISDSF